MIDHALKDRRSTSAMLHGIADGRALAWQSFEESHPNISQEELMEQFREDARYGRISIKNQLFDFSYKKFIAGFIVFIVIAA
jgi:hypothetical protein